MCVQKAKQACKTLCEPQAREWLWYSKFSLGMIISKIKMNIKISGWCLCVLDSTSPVFLPALAPFLSFAYLAPSLLTPTTPFSSLSFLLDAGILLLLPGDSVLRLSHALPSSTVVPTRRSTSLWKWVSSQQYRAKIWYHFSLTLANHDLS